MRNLAFAIIDISFTLKKFEKSQLCSRSLLEVTTVGIFGERTMKNSGLNQEALKDQIVVLTDDYCCLRLCNRTIKIEAATGVWRRVEHE